jgi:hypothetical protein
MAAEACFLSLHFVFVVSMFCSLVNVQTDTLNSHTALKFMCRLCILFSDPKRGAGGDQK